MFCGVTTLMVTGICWCVYSVYGFVCCMCCWMLCGCCLRLLLVVFGCHKQRPKQQTTHKTTTKQPNKTTQTKQSKCTTPIKWASLQTFAGVCIALVRVCIAGVCIARLGVCIVFSLGMHRGRLLLKLLHGGLWTHPDEFLRTRRRRGGGRKKEEGKGGNSCPLPHSLRMNPGKVL